MNKKVSNPPPPTNLEEAQRKMMAAIFNEWARRYAESPDEFYNILDKDGKPIADYGDECAAYYMKIAHELKD